MYEHSIIKISVIYFITLVIALFIIETGLQLTYYIWKGRFTWQSAEIFNVREFNAPVTDERFFTMRKNVRYHDKTLNFTVETDNHGFRLGSHQLSSQSGNVVFIGDSVPFGWGVNGADSVPSKLQTILAAAGLPWGVINAAIPSYSLDQAVHRYHYEIAGKFKVQAVILQIYDPASQFAILGAQWNVTDNWATFKEKMSVAPESRFLKYSSIAYLYHSFYGKVEEKLDPADQNAINKYKEGIINSLDRLNASLGEGAKEVIILSVTIPQDASSRTSPKRIAAVKILNETLSEYVTKQPNNKNKYTYIDLYKVFAHESPRKVFIDYSCHLSNYGADLEAKAIAAHLVN